MMQSSRKKSSNTSNTSEGVAWWVLVVIVIVALLAFAHARRYFRAFYIKGDEILAETTTILQASLADTTSDVLAEWSPLIVEDKLVDPVTSLTSTLLRWQYVWKSGISPVKDGDARSACRFTTIFARDEDTVIVMKKTREDPGVEIRLSMGRTLIVPPGFYYRVKEGYEAVQVKFHDSCTFFLSFFYQ